MSTGAGLHADGVASVDTSARCAVFQKSLKPARCQRTRVCGRTTTSAERHWNNRDSNARLTRVAASIRLGFTPRSTYRASCRRRNSTSACNDWRDRNASATAATRTTMETALSRRRSCHTRETEPLQDPQTGFLRTTAGVTGRATRLHGVLPRGARVDRGNQRGERTRGDPQNTARR